jgi:nucleoside-triphosphatase THEP1
LEKRIWLLTGDPAAGKSTALSKIILEVRTAGFTVGGILTREVRSHGEREGFRLLDISSDDSQSLAQVKGIIGPRIGKYRVNLKTLSTFAVAAFEHASKHSDIIAADEIGPMELLSPEFRTAVHSSVLGTDKPSVCVVHKRFQDPLIDELKASKNAVEYEVNFEHRDILPGEVAKDIIQFLWTQTPRGAKT